MALVAGPLTKEEFEVWRQCQALGVDIHLFGSLAPFADSDWYKLMAPDWGTVHLQRPLRLRRSFLWHYYPGLARALRAVQPDLIAVRSEAWGLLPLQVISGFSDEIPVVLGGAENQSLVHGNVLEAFARPKIARWTLSRSAGFMGWTRANVEIAKANGLRPGVPTVLNPAVPDPETFQRRGTRT